MNGKRKWAAIFLFAGVLAWLTAMAVVRDVSYAAETTGIVTAESLNVRSGAGTSFERLTSLSKGTAVTIRETVTAAGTSEKWYRISATVNGQAVDGYVSATYIAMTAASPTTSPAPVPTPAAPVSTVTYRNEISYKAINVSAKTLEKTNVYAKAGGKRKVIAKKKVLLNKGRSVKITAEKMVKGKKWFKISFTYKKKKRTGYVRNLYVKMTLKSSVPGAVNSLKTSIKVRPKADVKSGYKKSGNKYIRLAKGAEVTITKDIRKKKVKWYKLSYVWQGKTKTGYVAAKYIKLVKKKVVKRIPVTILSDADFEKSLVQQGFPDSYKESLRALHKKYPYWQFVAYRTNLDWNTVIDNESKLGVNLISNSKSAAWKSTEPGAYDAITGEWTVFDGSTWVAASRATISYYMDPRNFMNERNIFMFESLEYQSQYQTKAGVETILRNTPFAGKSFSYKDPETGAAKTISYTDAFLAAAKQSGVSPYHLASRVKQEVVTGPTTTSGAVTGTNDTYPGIYNFYNIGAVSSKNPVLNGLKWANSGTTYLRPWTDRYRSIVGGAMYIGTSYIAKGQNTGYLQKFNVTPYQQFQHQYMTNVEAAYSEAIKTKTAYAETMNATPIIFSIPVYNNMPAAACAAPQ